MRIRATAVLLLLAVTCFSPAAAARHGKPVPRHAEVLPFIQDDYARALHEARARKVPLFVEAWAPW